MREAILPTRLQGLFRRGYRFGERVVRDRFGIYQREDKIVADSQAFWEDVSRDGLEAGRAHWRGNGVFSDARWHEIGAHNLALFERMVGRDWLRSRAARIVDWGSGGGSNAVRFGVGAERYYGVDVTRASLEECGRQMEFAGLHNFVPVLIDAPHPERVRELVATPVDLIISTYVFEALPSKAYGERVLRVMSELLAPGGLAFLQIKYDDGSFRSRPFRWNYAQHVGDMTTYGIDEFWLVAQGCSLEPELVTLEPVQPLVDDRRYAYILLRKPDAVRS
jgi:hypothetical protein